MEHDLPDIILPTAQPKTWSGEQKLLYAVLMDAIAKYSTLSHVQSERARRLRDEDLRWFLSDNARPLYSFVSICTLLDFDPGSLRKGILSLGEKRVITYDRTSRPTTMHAA